VPGYHERVKALATDRLRMATGRAPGGLALVQELVNTGMRPQEAGPEDLLAEVGVANRWLESALGQWAAATGQPAPDLRLAEHDLAPLRRLRESVRALADGHGPGSAVGSAADPGGFPLEAVNVAMWIDADCRVRFGTSAAGWRGLAALVTAQIMLAQHAGLWPRFKACRHPECGAAFYDESRNNSRVWHDVRTCGNRANLANSRERRRAGGSAPAA
jgi:predicted RNA-binding Zn ribbon-like protein